MAILGSCIVILEIFLLMFVLNVVQFSNIPYILFFHISLSSLLGCDFFLMDLNFVYVGPLYKQVKALQSTRRKCFTTVWYGNQYSVVGLTHMISIIKPNSLLIYASRAHSCSTYTTSLLSHPWFHAHFTAHLCVVKWMLVMYVCTQSNERTL